MTDRLMIEAPKTPKARFLHILQGADAGAKASPSVVLHSSGNDAYDGVVIESTAILFPVDVDGPTGSLTYTAPSGTTRYLVAGLKPDTAYTVTVTESSSGITVAVAPGGSMQTDNAGLLFVR